MRKAQDHIRSGGIASGPRLLKQPNGYKMLPPPTITFFLGPSVGATEISLYIILYWTNFHFRLF